MITLTESPVRLFASSKSWIEGEAVRQLYAMARLPDVRRVVGFPDLHPGKGAPVGAAIVTEGMIRISLKASATKEELAETPPPAEYHLFRFIDFSAQPGKAYRYRVQLIVSNPNSNLPEKILVDPKEGKGAYKTSPWSAPSARIAVAAQKQ